MALKLECGYLKGFIGEHEYAAMASQVENAHALLASGKGPGNDFLGWVDLPTNYDKEECKRITALQCHVTGNTSGEQIAASDCIRNVSDDNIGHNRTSSLSFYFNLAITVWFPVVACPIFTQTSVPTGRYTSTREPNLMNPMCSSM